MKMSHANSYLLLDTDLNYVMGCKNHSNLGVAKEALNSGFWACSKTKDMLYCPIDLQINRSTLILVVGLPQKTNSHC